MSDPEQTMKMPKLPKGMLEKVGAIGNIGTLATLLFIGWEAKGAFDEQFAQVTDLADQVAALSIELRDSTEASSDDRDRLRKDLANANERVSDLKREIEHAYEKIALLEECITNRRRCKL